MVAETIAPAASQSNLLIMPNRFTDTLFQLIQSLEKAEKRNFKLYIKRSSGNDSLKIVELFEALDKMHEYDEAVLLKKLASIEKSKQFF